MQQTPDLNLLVALDALLTENSVAKAAKRLGLSDSAMSRTLTRLREATGDQLLVRAGRVMVPTPRADDLRERAREVVAIAGYGVEGTVAGRRLRLGRPEWVGAIHEEALPALSPGASDRKQAREP